MLICENQVYSKKLSKKVKDINTLVVLNFNQLDDDVKDEIIDKTKYDVYEWQDINAIRLIPKSRHEEITRIYIEDVVEEKFGAKKISSAALYNAISFEIRKVRMKKEALTSIQLIKEMNKISVVEKKLEFKDYIYLLNDLDKLNGDGLMRLVINKFSILSPSSKSAFTQDFDSKINLIIGEKDSGKTSLVRSIFYTLGCDVRGFDFINKMPDNIYLMEFDIDNKKYLLLRKMLKGGRGKNYFKVKNIDIGKGVY